MFPSACYKLRDKLTCSGYNNKCINKTDVILLASSLLKTLHKYTKFTIMAFISLHPLIDLKFSPPPLTNHAFIITFLQGFQNATVSIANFRLIIIVLCSPHWLNLFIFWRYLHN